MYVPPLHPISFLPRFSVGQLTSCDAITGSGLCTLENPSFVYLLIASKIPPMRLVKANIIAL